MINQIKSYISVVFVAVFVVGCAGMVDSMDEFAGLGVISQEKSTFDDATIISVSPTWLTDNPKSMGANKVKLGARWSSLAPDLVALVLLYDSNTYGNTDAYLSLRSIDINIDGSIHSFESGKSTLLDSGGYNSATRTIYTESKNNIIIPYALLEEMVASENCRLRVHTGKGYEDSIFSIERTGGGARTSRVTIRNFLEKIYEYRSKG